MDAKRPDVRVDETSAEDADGVVTKRDRTDDGSDSGPVRATLEKLVAVLRR